MNPNPLGMSTSWNAAAVVDGKRIVRGITSLGFSVLEVDYRVTAEAARDIKGLVEAGKIQVSSVHNFAPLAPREEPSNGGGHKLSLATADRDERRRAVALTLKSAELARDLGARALVLHLGETDLGREYHRQLSETVGAEGVASPEATRIREDVKTARRARIAPLLEAAVRSLSEILEGTGSDLAVCIENRNYYHQIPLAEEVVQLTERIGSPRLRYWHDVGHAHILDILGFLPHLETLRMLKPHLYGMHLHDARFTRDHLAPGTGDIDFAAVLAVVPASAVKVLELAPRVTREDILKALRYLEGFGVGPEAGL